jgi:Fe-S oxidoreductase
VTTAEEIGARLLVIPECGHAYGVLRWSGANLIGRPLPFTVLHITEYLAQLKQEGRISFRPIEKSITYHDPARFPAAAAPPRRRATCSRRRPISAR